MPMPRKPDPIKHCEHCGELMTRKREADGDLQSLLHFSRQKYCNRTCMAAAFDAKPSISSEWSVTHHHARKLVPPGPCAWCGNPDASDVHHVDGDHTNNARENLVRICRSCHVRHHSKRKSCTLCPNPHRARGYCDKHYQRWLRWGNPLIVNGEEEKP